MWVGPPGGQVFLSPRWGGEASCQALLSTHDSGVEVRFEGSLGTVVPTNMGVPTEPPWTRSGLWAASSH